MSSRPASEGVRARAAYRQGKSDGVAGPLPALALTCCHPLALRSVIRRWGWLLVAGSRFCCSPMAPLRRRFHPFQNPRGAGVAHAALAVAP